MSYATVSDLEEWLAPEPTPANAVRLLKRATTAINRGLHGIAYDTTDPEVQETLLNACVLQVHWMMDRDDESGAQDDLQSMSAGSRSFTRRTVGQNAGQTPRLCQAAVDELLASGHFEGFVGVYG